VHEGLTLGTRVQPSFYFGTCGHGRGSRGGLRGGRPPHPQYMVHRQAQNVYNTDQRLHGNNQPNTDNYYCNWCGCSGHRLCDCPNFIHELRKRAIARQGKIVVNAAIAADSKDEMDSDLDDLKDKLGLPYLNLAKTKLPKSAPWILDSGASTSLTGDASAIKNLKHVDTKVHVTTTGGQSHPVTGKGHAVFAFDAPINESVLYVPGVSWQRG
jgi:hypothetical protein